MELKIDIGFDQLLYAVRQLPDKQLKRLKAEIEQKESGKGQTDLQSLLLKGPVATKKQLETIQNNRKAFNILP